MFLVKRVVLLTTGRLSNCHLFRQPYSSQKKESKHRLIARVDVKQDIVPTFKRFGTTRHLSLYLHRADNLTTFMCRLSCNLGASTSRNPQGLSRPVMGLLYLLPFFLPCKHKLEALLIQKPAQVHNALVFVATPMVNILLIKFF